MSDPGDPEQVPLLKRLVSSRRGRVLASLGGVLFIGLCAQVEVPMVPVPMSLQTYAVLVIGAVAGPPLAGGTLLLYLLAGALGLPVFAGGASGLHHLAGNTAGYLVGFVLAAILVGFLAERWARDSFARLTVSLLLGHVVVLGLGATWLATKIGATAAIEGGFLPFLVGGLTKSILGAATVVWLERLAKRSSKT